MRIRPAASIGFGLVLAWTTSLAAQAPEALDQVAKDWEAAFNAGDLSTVVAMYTEDAMRAPPEADLIHGHEGIMANLQEFAGLHIKITTAGGILGDEFGSTWGNWELWSEGEMVDKGRWMNTVKVTAGGVKIHRDIWNSSVPVEEGCM